MHSSASRRDFLKAASGAFLAAPLGRSQQPYTPNVILILCDDLGYGDLHLYGSNIATPNLDRMAEEGVLFRQFYATSNVCSPSRASVMTGRYATRVGVPRVIGSQDVMGLALPEKTIADVLKPAGYRSMCVGKWHLGSEPQYLPTKRGFDQYYGIPYSNDMSPSILLDNTEVVESPVQLDTLTQRYTERAIDFIQRAKSSPFFVFFAHTFPHIPLAASAAFKGKSKLGLYADCVEEIDWSVGQILQTLKDNGLDDNTLVIFTSDNGPWFLGSPGKLRGRKGSSYEGGVREPFIARFPGRIPAQNFPGPLISRARSFSVAPMTASSPRVSGVMASTLDLLPTIAGLCRAPLPSAPMDGSDIWPILSGQQSDLTRELFLYFDDWHLQCARFAQWKIHVSRYNDFAWSPDPVGGRINLPLISPELYNLEEDPDESYDIAADNPAVVADLLDRMLKLLPTFPSQVMDAWNFTMSQKAYNQDGGLPAVMVPQR